MLFTAPATQYLNTLNPILRSMAEIQTRTVEGEILLHKSLHEALEYANQHQNVYKISFSIDGEFVKLNRMYNNHTPPQWEFELWSDTVAQIAKDAGMKTNQSGAIKTNGA